MLRRRVCHRLCGLVSLLLALLLLFLLFDRRNPVVLQEYATRDCGYLHTAMKGFMGSQMFMYATARGISEANDKRLFLPFETSKGLRQAFGSNLNGQFYTVSSSQHIISKRTQLVPSAVRIFTPSITSLECGKNYSIPDEALSWKYFVDIIPKLRDEFRFKEEILRKCHRVLKNIKRNSTDCLFIGVHLRRGDFLNSGAQLRGFSAAKENLLHFGANFFMKRFPNRCLHFIVIGVDDEFNLRSASKVNHSNVHLLHASTQPLDLCILSHCNHSITSTGSFGWMAAFLANGITVYQSEQHKPGSTLAKDTVIEDYIPPHWIPIDG